VANGRIGASLGQAITLFRVGAVGSLSDGQLLERFASGRGEAGELAFAALVERHGPLVARICRSILADTHEAQDAYQAAFLVLARKAGSLWVRESLGPWLHGVAYRVAIRARSASALRKVHERRHAEAASAHVGERPWDEEVGPLLHEEVNRLPDRYRVPVVLCYLEGLTHEQAAEQLRWPVGTVRSRLSRGRDQLRSRLVRRGVAPAIGLLGALSTTEAFAASRFAPGLAPARVAAWADGEVKAMTLTKLKVGLLALGIAAAGVGTLAATTAFEQEQGAAAKAISRPPGDAEKIQGLWTVVDMQQVNHEPTEEERKFWKSGGFTMTITADRIIWNIDNSQIRYTLDPSKSPKGMSLELVGEPDRGGLPPDQAEVPRRPFRRPGLIRNGLIPAIYQLKGDDLMICEGRSGDGQPPVAFSVTEVRPEHPFPTLFVLKRSSSMPDAVKRRIERDRFVQEARAQLQAARANAEVAMANYEAAMASARLAEEKLRAAEADQKKAEGKSDDAPPR
jgi:RNA polymerase sigma factor (sigma-70 family)